VERKRFYATKKLKGIRIERELTQQEMADALSIVLGKNVSLSTYQKWEQGTNSLTFGNAIIVSRELKTSIKELWRTK
jgi:transcriptional regulator with XRE-family HTH domain